MASFYVRKESYGWRVIEETWKDGERQHKTVPKLAYSPLGFNPDWTLEQAKKHVKSLNKRNAYDRKIQGKIAGAVRRVEAIKKVESGYLPEHLVDLFHKKLEDSTFGSAEHNRRMYSHWKTVCLLIKELKLDVSKFHENSDQIYQYFISQEFSSDYSKKLIRLLNMWGKFVSQYRKTQYEPVPPPKGNKKSKIDDAYLESDGYRGESDPLTPSYLVDQSSFKVEQWNWLSVSVWFGLRPREIDQLKNTKNWRIEKIDGVDVLWVYQSKLTSIERSKRWKGIPCIFPEQKALLEVIRAAAVKRPILKTLHSILGTDRITLYGGRKGFVDLMLDRGQKLEDISMWLGHQSIEITWEKYRNKRRVSFTKAG